MIRQTEGPAEGVEPRILSNFLNLSWPHTNNRFYGVNSFHSLVESSLEVTALLEWTIVLSLHGQLIKKRRLIPHYL
jgi:hypothetical protein